MIESYPVNYTFPSVMISKTSYAPSDKAVIERIGAIRSTWSVAHSFSLLDTNEMYSDSS